MTANQPGSYVVANYAAPKVHLRIMDVIPLDHLVMCLADAQGQETHSSITIGRCKLLAHDVLSGRAERQGWKHEIMDEGRMCRLEYDASGKYSRIPFRVSMDLDTDDGSAGSTTISLRFAVDDFVLLWLEVRDYLAAHQREIEAVRWRTQVEDVRK